MAKRKERKTGKKPEKKKIKKKTSKSAKSKNKQGIKRSKIYRNLKSEEGPPPKSKSNSEQNENDVEMKDDNNTTNDHQENPTNQHEPAISNETPYSSDHPQASTNTGHPETGSHTNNQKSSLPILPPPPPHDDKRPATDPKKRDKLVECVRQCYEDATKDDKDMRGARDDSAALDKNSTNKNKDDSNQHIVDFDSKDMSDKANDPTKSDNNPAHTNIFHDESEKRRSQSSPLPTKPNNADKLLECVRKCQNEAKKNDPVPTNNDNNEHSTNVGNDAKDKRNDNSLNPHVFVFGPRSKTEENKRKQDGSQNHSVDGQNNDENGSNDPPQNDADNPQ